MLAATDICNCFLADLETVINLVFNFIPFTWDIAFH